MAPKRRTSSGPVSKSSQSTLSFNNKNRITKPISAPSKDLKSSKPKTDPVIVEPLVSNREKTSVAIANDAPQISAQDIETEPTTAEAAILQQAEQEKQRIVKAEEPTAEEKQAREVSDAKIKAYWREKERQSKAPRVHQQDLSLEEKVLREWDVSGDYGVRRSFLSYQYPISISASRLIR